MKKPALVIAGLIAALGIWSTHTLLNAQPPGPGGGPEGDHGRPPGNPLVDILDTNHDHVIDAEEIKAASNSLLKLDRNGDGRLSDDEIRPERGGRPPAGDRGPQEGPPPRDGQRRDFGPPPGGPGPGPGPGAGPPDPVRFVEHAMQFDANGDGMLSRDELMAFAKDMPNHRPGGEHPGGGRPSADRPGGGPSDGNSSRPRRPSLEE